MSLNPNQRVHDAVLDIKHGKYQIPSIQRGYEWKEDRVTKLLDSIMSGYPIGAIMVWKPNEEIKNDIPCRNFDRDFISTSDYLSVMPHEADSSDTYLVLDGQQRLQSLYLCFFGSYNKKRVYFLESTEF